MPELKSSQYSIKFAWGCLIIALIIINTNYFLSKYRNSISKKPISRSLEDTHDYKNISITQKNNRKLLLDIMTKNGFSSYSKEWWHYTFINEPFPTTYFDFTINK